MGWWYYLGNEMNLLQKLNARISPGKLHYGPDWLVLGVNNLCNLHCKMCDVGTGYDQSNFHHHLVGARPLNMPIELIKRIFDQAQLHYPRTKIGYAFTEPIIYPHLTESIAYANERGLFTSITTNALKLRVLAEDLTKAGLDDIFISLDGPPDVHNEIRGNRQSFEWAMEGMEAVWAQRGQKPGISVFCTITEWNIGRLEEFLRILEGKPVKTVGFMHTNYTPDSLAAAHNGRFGSTFPATASNMEGIDLNKMNLEVLWKEIQAILKKDWGFPVVFSPTVATFEKLKSFYHEPEKKIGRVCNDAFRNVMIKSDGTVIPAHGRCYDVVAGNLYELDLPEIWNSEPLARFRRALMKEGGLLPACSRCCSAF